MLELVELTDGHGRVAADGRLDHQPVPRPPHPQIVNSVDARHRGDSTLGLLHHLGVDAIEQSAADVAAGPDQQHHDRGTDQQAHNRISQEKAEPDPDHPGHHRKGGEAVGTGMDAVGDQRR